MIRVLLCLALLAQSTVWATPSQAQGFAIIIPATLNGYGVLSVTAASVAASTATPGPNAAPFPTGALPGRTMEVKSAVGSAGTLYVCPLGGTCTALVGIPIAPGESKTWALSSATSVTVIAATTATAIVSW